MAHLADIRRYFRVRNGDALVPMPLPERLAWLQFVLGALPATLIALHWIPLAACRSALAESAPITTSHGL